MGARAYWKGNLRLALVSIPVEIYAATKGGAAVSFRQIHEPSGKPISYEKSVKGIGPVDPHEIMKGYEISRGNYVLLKNEEIEAVRIESKRTLELVQFVEAHEIDVFYFEMPYYMVPSDELAEEAYVVLREALRRKGKVALGQLSVRGREQLVSLKPCGKGIVLETLRYEDEVRDANSYFRHVPDIEPSPELLDLASTLIDQKTAEFETGAFRDRYVDALKRLVEKKAKAKGRTVLEDVEEPASRHGDNVIDLMAALKKSVGTSEAGVPAKKTPAKKRARKRA